MYVKDNLYFQTSDSRIMTASVLTIYMENPEIPVGESNGTHHSIWSTSEIMGFWSSDAFLLLLLGFTADVHTF